MHHLFLLAGVFFVISTVFAMLGMGGGILYVPILLFAGSTIKEAPAISLLLILGTSLAAMVTFSRNNKVDWKLAFVIDPPTDVMAFVGGCFSALVPAGILKGILAGVLLIAGALMLKQPTAKAESTDPAGLAPRRRWHWHRKMGEVEYSVNLPLVLTATAAIGILSGMLGITGGIIKLPIMVLLCGVPMDIAVATSTVMVAVTALSGLVGHAVHEQIDWRLGLTLAIAAVAGGLLGSHISLKTDKTRLKKAFGVVVWLVAVRIVWQLASPGGG